MLNYMGFSCWTSSGNTPLQTYSEDISGNVKSAWIASEAGKPFSVHWQDKSGKRVATSGHVFIDGKDVASAIIRPGRATPVKRSGAKVGKGMIKPFVFSELSLTDDDTLANRYDASLANVGVIKVEIKRVRLGAEVPFAGYDARNHGLVHERAKKAGAHCTTFAQEKRVESSRTVGISTAPYDPNEPGPYVVFEFRYRSLGMLKATGIIKSPSRKRMIDTSNDDIIEITSSSEDEDSSETLCSASPQITPETPQRKRIKSEPQTDDLILLPRTSSLVESSSEYWEDTNDRSSPFTHSLPEPTHTQNSEGITTPPVDDSQHQAIEVIKEETQEEEELDMLDSEGALSTDQSQIVDPLAVDLPPPSSSPGPECVAEEDGQDES